MTHPTPSPDPATTDTITPEPGVRGLWALWKTKDAWAVWLGLLLFTFGLWWFVSTPVPGLERGLQQTNQRLQQEARRAPFRTLEWYTYHDFKRKYSASNTAAGHLLKAWTPKLHRWKHDPLEAFVLTSEQALQKGQKAFDRYRKAQLRMVAKHRAAQKAQRIAAQAGFKDPQKNTAAQQAIAAYRRALRSYSKAKKANRPKTYNLWLSLLVAGLGMGLLFALGIQLINGQGLCFLLGFPFVYGLAILAYLFAAQASMKSLGIGYAAWAIVLGLLISNTVGTPGWVRPAVQVEFFIKTGLVLLGAEILLGKSVAIGITGLLVAWVALGWITYVKPATGNHAQRPSWGVLWERFPKFVLGFLFASLLASWIYRSLGSDLGNALFTGGVNNGWTKIWRGWFFCLGFVSIGLATDFRELKRHFTGGKPLILYLCGQFLNLALTLGVAYLMFYVFFPQYT